jgi:hypothetical protein
MVFMHDGDGRGQAVPAVVGEDTDEFVRTDVGWRFASRTFETLFAWPFADGAARRFPARRGVRGCYPL